MGSPLLLLLLALLTAVTKAKVFSQGELAHLLQGEELDGYGGYSLATWLCMAFYKTTFNTAAQSIKVDSSANYSIFQISSQQWCTNDRSPSDLLSSNITDDIICAKRIVRNPQGMDAWKGWAMLCKGRDLSEWVEGCDL
ncbi:lysozyme C, milk isozyme-like [Calonectris borealis]|uniref:lysozyme C, milk isozyme-like n=1 Tax=Calonectris borealis TaxID=1323832 RepID=UPI003F4BAC23